MLASLNNSLLLEAAGRAFEAKDDFLGGLSL